MKIAARERFEGEFTIPGDKSITHRAVMLGGIAEGEAVIKGALTGEDCLSTCACMRKLGARVEIDGENIWVKGAQEFRSGMTIDCGNSGTTMRLLTGLLAGRGISATLVGDASLSARPMKRVVEPLLELGASVQTQNGFAPVSVFPAELTGVRVQTQVSSAQV
jgi:3-phosphoshikimate 1-carboxyvinyltransferase